MCAVGSPSVIMMICFVPDSAGEQLAGEHEAVVHVRAVHEVPLTLGQLCGGEDARRLAEPDDAQVVAGELRGDQRVQRHRHLLGRQEVVAHRHRQRQVEHQHRRRTGEVLGALDLEVVGRQLHRRARRRCARERVADRAVAGRAGTGRRTRRPWSRRCARGPGPRLVVCVLADLVLGQLGEQVAQRVRCRSCAGPSASARAGLPSAR